MTGFICMPGTPGTYIYIVWGLIAVYETNQEAFDAALEAFDPTGDEPIFNLNQEAPMA